MTHLLRRVASACLLVLPTTAACSLAPAVDGTLKYEVELVATPRLALEVTARFQRRDQAMGRFEVADATAARFITISPQRDETVLAPGDEGWEAAAPVHEARFSYRVDIEAMADDLQDVKVARRAGEAVYASWTSWLVRPAGIPAGAPVELHCSADSGLKLALGGAPGGTLSTQAVALQHRVYAMFGTLDLGQIELEGRPGAPASRITVAMPRDGYSVRMPEVLDWVGQIGQRVADFAGGFPAERVLVMMSPIEGHPEVAFGRVQPSPYPAVCLFAGTGIDRAALHDDWILMHELIHLAFPPVEHEARWIDEGVATYFEPILRCRAGDLTEVEMWTELSRGLRRGLPTLQKRGLHGAEEVDDVYWGGALFCFLLDVESRRASNGARGLEDGIRGMCADGYSVAGQTRSIDEIIPAIDRGIGGTLARDLAQRFVHGHDAVDLNGLFRALGIERVGKEVRLTDDAPWAHVRRAIVRPNSESRRDRESRPSLAAGAR